VGALGPTASIGAPALAGLPELNRRRIVSRSTCRGQLIAQRAAPALTGISSLTWLLLSRWGFASGDTSVYGSAATVFASGAALDQLAVV
jgi:hypothetical protein